MQLVGLAIRLFFICLSNHFSLSTCFLCQTLVSAEKTRVLAAASEDATNDVATFYSPNAPLDHAERIGSFRSEDNVDPANNEYSFFDEAVITVRAGSGGQGSNTFKKGVGNQNGPPDGGNGGKGGDVIFRLDASLNTLAGLSQAWRPNSFGGSGAATPQRNLSPKHFRAENGQPGMRQFKAGAAGKDVVVRLPPGTLIQNTVEKSDGSIKFVDLGTINEAYPEIMVAQGGRGGEGTAVLKSGRGVKRPRFSAEGGERKKLKLTLKIVADVALVGVPNAGKSTFLAAITSAKPKIANYPFTTIIPNLGVWIPGQDDRSSSALRGAGSEGLVICDVPGLIKGASEGVGLGHAFLRHVERCHVMVHLIDATSIDPVADYEMLNKEVTRYGGTLASIPQVVVVNKIDAYDDLSKVSKHWEEGLSVRVSREELEGRLKAAMPHSRLMWMSAREENGLDDLMVRLSAFVRKVKQAKEVSPAAD